MKACTLLSIITLCVAVSVGVYVNILLSTPAVDLRARYYKDDVEKWWGKGSPKVCQAGVCVCVCARVCLCVCLCVCVCVCV